MFLPGSASIPAGPSSCPCRRYPCSCQYLPMFTLSQPLFLPGAASISAGPCSCPCRRYSCSCQYLPMFPLSRPLFLPGAASIPAGPCSCPCRRYSCSCQYLPMFPLSRPLFLPGAASIPAGPCSCPCLHLLMPLLSGTGFYPGLHPLLPRARPGSPIPPPLGHKHKYTREPTSVGSLFIRFWLFAYLFSALQRRSLILRIRSGSIFISLRS